MITMETITDNGKEYKIDPNQIYEVNIYEHKNVRITLKDDSTLILNKSKEVICQLMDKQLI